MKQAAKISQDTLPALAPDWRSFPEFEQILGSEERALPLLEKVEKTCRQLNDILHSGSAPDKVRAQLSMTAYGRSLDLLHFLTELRDAQQQR